MNMPARFESLLWMATPMMAWAQAGAETARPRAEASKPVVANAVPPNRARRKRRKASA